MAKPSPQRSGHTAQPTSTSSRPPTCVRWRPPRADGLAGRAVATRASSRSRAAPSARAGGRCRAATVSASRTPPSVAPTRGSPSSSHSASWWRSADRLAAQALGLDRVAHRRWPCRSTARSRGARARSRARRPRRCRARGGRRRRPAARSSGRPSTRSTWPCANSATSPPGSSARAITRSARSPTWSGRLAARRAVAPDAPARALLADLGRGPALVVAVVELAQVGLDLRALAEPGQLARLAGAAPAGW